MNVAIKFILAEANIMQCYKTPPVKDFMDDLFLKLKNVGEVQILLDRTSCVLKWARMSLKASKSKTLVQVNGKVDHDAKLYINANQFRELIPTICSNPVKFLGCAISFDLMK